MSQVDKQEMAQWLLGILALCQEYDDITVRITAGWRKGPAEYKEALAGGELPALLEKLKKMPVPEDSECQRVVEDFEDGVNARIKAEAVTAEYEGGTIDKNLSTSRALWLSAARTCLRNMINDLVVLREKYQV